MGKQITAKQLAPDCGGGVMATRKDRIQALESSLSGLRNDARYWDLRRTYGDHSREVERHLQSCAEYQRAEVALAKARRAKAQHH